MNDRRLTFIFTGMLCAAVLLVGCGRPRAVTGADTKAALTVELVSPQRSNWPEQIGANGRIAAWQESIIGAEIGDLKLEEVLVEVGDVVTQGQPLARFNVDAPNADLALAKAFVAEMEASADLARENAARARRLEGTGTLSEEDMLRYEAAEKTSSAQLASAQAKLRLQRLRCFHTEVRAPDDGIISSRSATVGAVGGAGAELFRMIRQQRLEWRALVSADQLARVAPGQPVTLRPAGASLVEGIVRQVSPVVNSATLDGTVYVDLPEPGPLRVGMFVSGDLCLSSSPVLHVPESTLVFRGGFQYVMTVDASHRVHQVKVSTGRRRDQSVEILEANLSVADRVILSGGSFLNEGDTVQVATPSATDGAVWFDTEGAHP